MHAIVLALAVSLALGPAATEAAPVDVAAPTAAPAAAPAGKVEAPAEDASAEPAPVEAPESSEGAPAAEPTGEPPGAPEPEPEPEPEPPTPTEPEPEPPTPTEQPATVTTSSAPPAADPAPPIIRDRLGCDGSKRCRKMTVAGIVVGALGVSGVGVGIGLLVNRDQVVPETPVFVTSTRPAGLVLLTVSSGVAFTAVLMLVAAHKGYKDRPERARIQLTPTGLRF
ncbi:hypothetical protein DB30_07522 [Enhygromyxa salina]|uniref:Uncharacterized protein n=1 Tax=Enhygromyxa salina TaxID=215803 RepID=A0A0C1Z849_9BACT|nr:hypothetical protein [Enhygromyxa salina]KIG13809.1 hypothetical protein DB30_07522 [Enhygromyxa salina]